MDITVIVPTYNEKDNIGELTVMLLSLPYKVSVLIIDDNSPDGTGQLVDELSVKHEQVHVSRPSSFVRCERQGIAPETIFSH